MKRFYIFGFITAFAFISAAIMNPANAVNSTGSAAIKYDLAYPGILPDNPLYKLKVLRDKIIVQTIMDPEKKVNFYLLQTDKGILASAMLVDQNKINLAKETLLKAENNYTILTFELKKFDKKPNAQLFKKLETASLKHQEIISSLAKRVPKEDQKTFETVLEFTKRNLQTVKKLQNKKYYYRQ